MLNKSKELFDSMANYDICYCHWKSNEHLKEGLDGDTDLDVLFDVAQKEIIESTLRKCDFMQCKSQYGSRYPDVDDWIGFDSNTGKLIHLHLHYKIVTGHKGMKEYRLPWSELTLQTRIKDEETSVYIMEPNLEIVTLYTRIGLKASVKKLHAARKNLYKLSEDDSREITYLKKKVDWDTVSVLLNRYYFDDASVILDLMHNETIDSSNFLLLNKLASKRFAKNRKHGSVFCVLIKYYYIFAMRFLGVCKNKFGFNLISRKVKKNKKGAIVAFIGQDGSGKSTVSNIIRDWWTWKMDAQKFYLGSGEHYSSWQKRLHNAIPQKKNFITKLLSAWLTLSDYVALSKNVYNKVKRAEKYAEKGGLAIFDRFPQIEYAGINDGPKIRSNYLNKIHNSIVRVYALHCARVEEKFLKKAVVFAPNVVFKLMLSPEESLKRKPEENIDVVRKKHEIIKKMDFAKDESIVVDATMPFDDEIRLIKNRIWEYIQK